MGRPRAPRSLSEHNIKDMTVPYHPDVLPNLSLQYTFSDAENDPEQTWLSPTETYKPFDMATTQVTAEKNNHFSPTTDIIR